MTEQILAGKVAIVTGAASPIGMGHSMAAATVEAGGRVAIFDINPDWLEQSAADIRAIGGDDCVLPVAVDVTDPDAIAEGVSRVIKELGGLHILMNNAGVWKADSFREVSIEKLEADSRHQSRWPLLHGDRGGRTGLWPHHRRHHQPREHVDPEQRHIRQL